MTSPVPQVRVRGLYTGRGLVDAPADALQVADNVVCLLPGTVEPRRGDELLSATPRSSAGGPHASAVAYATRMLAHVASETQVQIIDADTDTAGTYAATMHPRGGIPMRALGRQAYLCTGAGVQIAEASPSVAIRPAGVPRMLDLRFGGYWPSAGGPDPVKPNSVVAYRAVWGYRYTMPGTGEVREHWGAPSAIMVVRNTNTTSPFYPTITVPWPGSGAAGGVVNLVRLYRTDNATPATASPGDEMFLVLEQAVTSGVSPSTVVMRDLSPDAFLGAPLYTNADTGDGEGAAGANLQPPLVCSDVASWDARAWYGSFATRGSTTVQLIGTQAFVTTVPRSTLFLRSFNAAGAVVTGETYQAIGTDPGVAGYFVVTTSGTPSQNVEATARSLVANINAYSAIAFASYASSLNDPPGMIEIWPRAGLDIASVLLATDEDSAVSEMFSPVLPTDIASHEKAQIRYLDVRPGVLVWSKPGQPESVPPLNSLLVGDPYEPIIGMAGLRDGLVVAKTDGLYLVHGSAGQYGVQTLDASVRMPSDARMGGRGTCQVLNNELYLHASDGRVYVASESGVRAIDADVMDALRWARSAWGAVDERDGLYVLGLRDDIDAVSQAYVYSSETRAWTRWAPLGVGAYRHWMTAWPRGGFASFLGSILRTRSNGTVDDYQDYVASISLTFNTPAGGVQSIASGSLASLRAGAELVNAAAAGQRGVLLSGGSILLTGAAFTSGVPLTVSVTNPIEARILSVPWHGGQPAARKSVAACELTFDRYGLSTQGVTPSTAQTPWAQFQREASGGDGHHTNVVIPDPGLLPEEVTADWAARVQPRSVRVVVPRQQQSTGMLSVGLSTKQVRAFWRLAGWTLEVAAGGTAVSR